MEKSLEFLGYFTYSILSNGSIKDLRTGSTLATHLNQQGYRMVNLKNPDGQKGMSIARLLALAFIPNPEDKPEVDHINRNKDDNRLENLRWVTREENIANRGDFKNNTSGHKHINIEDGYYRIQISRSEKHLRVRRKTLEEAIAVRDAFLASL